jgi:RNA polymerase sigma factor (sigma-70 family)
VKGPRPVADPPGASWTDARLVRECLRGNEDAWAALVDRYKRLIFSIPVKQGFSREDAADIFQKVCLLLLAELPDLREPKALPMWLIRVTSRECGRWKRQEGVYTDGENLAHLEDARDIPDQVLSQVKEEQVLREAMRAMSPRCQDLIQMLFFESPARPYQEVARSLGLAIGSIGFIRGRCLARLRRELERMGFR